MNIETLSKHVLELREEMAGLKRKAGQAKTIAEEAKGLCEGKLLDKAKQDCSEIHELYRVQHLKTCVMTEVSMLMRQRKYTPARQYRIQNKIVEAFDFDNRWWLSRDHKTLGSLLDEFEGLLNTKAA